MSDYGPLIKSALSEGKVTRLFFLLKGGGPTDEDLAELPLVMQKLYAEPWFPKSVSMELHIVLSILLRYLDLDPNAKRHESIMEYVVEISK